MPIKTKIVLRDLKFDKGGFTKAAEKAARTSVYQAARAWLEAVIVNVPIWSGQALGSVKYAKGRTGPSSGLFLGQYLKVAIPINAPHPKPYKNEDTGGLQGRFTFSDSRHQFRFTYQTDVVYYVIQDFFNIGISPTAPWGSLVSGENAFQLHLALEMATRLPKVNDYLLDVAEHE